VVNRKGLLTGKLILMVQPNAQALIGNEGIKSPWKIKNRGF